jgi:hypothetical protein
VDRISCPAPPPAPSLPDITEDLLSAFRTDHDVKRQAEFMGGSTWLSDREALDGSRYLASKYLLSEAE